MARKDEGMSSLNVSAKRKLAPHENSRDRKRSKTAAQSLQLIDYLTPLSDELLIRILSLLPLETILLVQSVSRRYQLLARDSQIWKGLYYTRFVLPRAVRGARVGISKDEGLERLERVETSRIRWLAEERLLEWERGVGRSGKTDWKARYRLRSNWSRGQAEVRMVDVARSTVEERSPAVSRKLIVRMARGIAITANRDVGLQAWSLKSQNVHHKGLPLAGAQLYLDPTSLAIDSATTLHDVRIIVGFANGSFEVWNLSGDINSGFTWTKLSRYKSHLIGHDNALTAVAYSHPYILSISTTQLLSAYILKDRNGAVVEQDVSDDTASDPADITPFHPCLLASLKSHTSWPPLTLSIRSTPSAIVASVAYSIPTYTSGWTVGLQELHLSDVSGEILLSRLATAVDTGFRSLLTANQTGSDGPSNSYGSQTDGRGRGSHIAIPSSLSYSHPYLLAGHRDNTLTLYMVKSDAEGLTIGRGSRLWGHTSEISGAMIGGRGKAVSVGAGAGEIRVWELEGGRRGRGAENGGGSIEVSAESKNTDLYRGVGCRGWIGFDDEFVVVKSSGRVSGMEGLLIYDFT